MLVLEKALGSGKFGGRKKGKVCYIYMREADNSSMRSLSLSLSLARSLYIYIYIYIYAYNTETLRKIFNVLKKSRYVTPSLFPCYLLNEFLLYIYIYIYIYLCLFYLVRRNTEAPVQTKTQKNGTLYHQYYFRCPSPTFSFVIPNKFINYKYSSNILYLLL